MNNEEKDWYVQLKEALWGTLALCAMLLAVASTVMLIVWGVGEVL